MTPLCSGFNLTIQRGLACGQALLVSVKVVLVASESAVEKRFAFARSYVVEPLVFHVQPVAFVDRQFTRFDREVVEGYLWYGTD